MSLSLSEMKRLAARDLQIQYYEDYEYDAHSAGLGFFGASGNPLAKNNLKDKKDKFKSSTFDSFEPEKYYKPIRPTKCMDMAEVQWKGEKVNRTEK